MLSSRAFAVVLLLLAPLCVQAQSFEPLQEPIRPVQLRAGDTTTVFVADLFVAEDYDGLTFGDGDLATRYDAEAGTLTLAPPADHAGLGVVPFSFDGLDYTLLTQTTARVPHTFTYRAEETPDAVHVFGQFNDWSRTADALTDEDGDGAFETTLLLEPGRYQYKLFVDEREVMDPSNPDSIPNPFGAYNNVVTIEDPVEGELFLHRIAHGQTVSGASFVFAPTLDEVPVEPDELEVLTLLDNMPGVVHVKPVGVGQHEGFEVTVPSYVLEGRHTLRVTARRPGGVFAPIQSIELIDGRPAAEVEGFASWRDAVVYSIVVDRFRDGDPANTRPNPNPEVAALANFHGGDLQGVLDVLQSGYLDRLGVNTLWLSPVIRNPEEAFREFPEPHRYFTGYHGYWPTEPREVDPRFGSMELLQTLVDSLEGRDKRLLLDFVSNHTHEQHPYFQNHPEWFGELVLPDGRENLRLWDEQRLTTWFDRFLPSFDFVESEAAAEQLTDDAVWWLRESGAHGFRQDAVKHVPNTFWRLMTRKLALEVEPERGQPTYQIGETFGSYDLIGSYVQNGQLDAQFNFNLYDAAHFAFLAEEGSFRGLAAELERTHRAFGQNHLMGNPMDSHDKIRYVAYADGDISITEGDLHSLGWTNPPQVDDPQTYREAQLYLAFITTIPGVPVVYYGDEIGLSGASDPDNRRPMRFDEELTAPERAHLTATQRIVSLREELPALRHGDYQLLTATDDQLAYLRSDFSERVAVVFNKSEEAATVPLALPTPTAYDLRVASDVLSGERFSIRDGALEVPVEGLGFRVLVLE